MDKELKHELQMIAEGFDCKHDFKCCGLNYSELCRASDIGLDWYIECLEPVSIGCRFRLSFGHSILCKCPLRIHIEKHASMHGNGLVFDTHHDHLSMASTKEEKKL